MPNATEGLNSVKSKNPLGGLVGWGPLLLLLKKAALEQFWGCKPGHGGPRGHGNKEAERGVDNGSRDTSYKSREKNKSMGRSWYQGTVFYFFVLLFLFRWLTLRRVHAPERVAQERGGNSCFRGERILAEAKTHPEALGKDDPDFLSDALSIRLL